MNIPRDFCIFFESPPGFYFTARPPHSNGTSSDIRIVSQTEISRRQLENWRTCSIKTPQLLYHDQEHSGSNSSDSRPITPTESTRLSQYPAIRVDLPIVPTSDSVSSSSSLVQIPIGSRKRRRVETPPAMPPLDETLESPSGSYNGATFLKVLADMQASSMGLSGTMEKLAGDVNLSQWSHILERDGSEMDWMDGAYGIVFVTDIGCVTLTWTEEEKTGRTSNSSGLVVNPKNEVGKTREAVDDAEMSMEGEFNDISTGWYAFTYPSTWFLLILMGTQGLFVMNARQDLLQNWCVRFFGFNH